MIKYKINSCNYDIKKFIKTIINEFDINYWDEWLEEQDYDILQVKPNIFISCETKNELIGTCSIKVISSDECYLNSFYVKKEFRNKGIGSKLYDICEKYVIDNNYKRINLKVDPNFKDAINFYENRNYIFYEYKEKEIYYYKNVVGNTHELK